MPPSEVFLSHSSHDRRMAARLAATVTAHGLSVWYSPTEIVGAQQWHDEIGKALSRCDWFMVILSPQSVTSKWVKRELLFALQNDRYNDHIVPILDQACDYTMLSWTLSSIQMVDFSHDFADGCRRLLQVWRVDYNSELLG